MSLSSSLSRSYCYFTSTIGSKQIMGITGLLWCGFLLSHMAGNLLLLVSAEAYNKYSHALTSNPLIYLAEAVLVATLVGHAIKGIIVTRRNRMAKPVRSYASLSGEKDSTFASKTMIFQGLLILVFVVLHLISFKFGTVYEVNYGGVVMRDIYKLVFEKFHDPVYVGFYMVCVFAVGMHLSHGFYSSVQTLGIHHPSWNPKIQKMGYAFAALVMFGFLIQPIAVYLK